jgi:hypothetical protein
MFAWLAAHFVALRFVAAHRVVFPIHMMYSSFRESNCRASFFHSQATAFGKFCIFVQTSPQWH